MFHFCHSVRVRRNVPRWQSIENLGHVETLDILPPGNPKPRPLEFLESAQKNKPPDVGVRASVCCFVRSEMSLPRQKWRENRT